MNGLLDGLTLPIPAGMPVDYHGSQRHAWTPLSGSWLIHSVCDCPRCQAAAHIAEQMGIFVPPRYRLAEADRPHDPELAHVRRTSFTLMPVN